MAKTPEDFENFDGEETNNLDDYPSKEPYADDDLLLDDEDDEDEDELSGLEGEELNMVEKGVSATVLTSEQAIEVAGIRRAELSVNPEIMTSGKTSSNAKRAFWSSGSVRGPLLGRVFVSTAIALRPGPRMPPRPTHLMKTVT